MEPHTSSRKVPFHPLPFVLRRVPLIIPRFLLSRSLRFKTQVTVFHTFLVFHRLSSSDFSSPETPPQHPASTPLSLGSLGLPWRYGTSAGFCASSIWRWDQECRFPVPTQFPIFFSSALLCDARPSITVLALVHVYPSFPIFIFLAPPAGTVSHLPLFHRWCFDFLQFLPFFLPFMREVWEAGKTVSTQRILVPVDCS